MPTVYEELSPGSALVMGPLGSGGHYGPGSLVLHRRCDIEAGGHEIVPPKSEPDAPEVIQADASRAALITEWEAATGRRYWSCHSSFGVQTPTKQISPERMDEIMREHRGEKPAEKTAPARKTEAPAKATKILSQEETEHLAHKAWSASIMALDEARTRPITAEKICSAYGPGVKTVEECRRMLAGLPSEQTSVATLVKRAGRSAPQTDEDEVHLRRRLELALPVLAKRVDRNEAGARDEMWSVKYALQQHASTKDKLSTILLKLSLDPQRYLKGLSDAKSISLGGQRA